jgi:glutamyl/glutaminyl-tRNA synthetase
MAYLLELPAETFVEKARSYFVKHNVSTGGVGSGTEADAAYFREVMLISQPKIKGFEELPAYTKYFFVADDSVAVDSKVREKVLAKGDPKARLSELAALLAKPEVDFSNDTAIEEAIKAEAAKNGLGFGDYQAIARLAVSGTNVGPGLTSLFRVLGRERTLKRIERFVATLA